MSNSLSTILFSLFLINIIMLGIRKTINGMHVNRYELKHVYFFFVYEMIYFLLEVHRLPQIA